MGAQAAGVATASVPAGLGIIEGAEKLTNSVYCDADCSLALCGDSYVNLNASEALKLLEEGDACLPNCEEAICGDVPMWRPATMETIIMKVPS